MRHSKKISTEMWGDMWDWTWLDDVLKDVRHTGRMLRDNVLFSVVAVLTLALGIGANTAIFSVTNAVLLRALPVQNPRQLFYLHVLPGQPDGAGNTGDSESSFSEYVFERLRTQHQAFSNLLAYVPVGFNKIAVRAGATPEEAAVDMVSGDFFSGLGVRALCGRTLDLADEKDHGGVAVLGYGFWTRRFGQNCSAIGKTLYIKGVPFTIVGVAAKNFFGVEGRPTDAWIPLQKRPELNACGAEGENYYAAPNWWCLVGRNAAWQREFSIRMAIGGSRARLFRQLLVEGLVLVGFGGLLGWLFTLIATRALASWAGIEVSLAPDSRLLLFTAGISLVAGLIFGLARLFSAT